MLSLLLLVVTAQDVAPVVTRTMRIEVDGKPHRARQINGRWWTEDNRELNRTNAAWLWTVSKNAKAHEFHHHRPFDPARIQYLSRSSSGGEVRSILGDPNSILPTKAADGLWFYYAANGARLMVMISDNKIWTADWQSAPGVLPRDVPHLAFRTSDGKTSRESFAEQQTSPPRDDIWAEHHRRIAELRASMPSRRNPAPIEQYTAPPASREPRRLVERAKADAVKPGMTRAELMAQMGQPASKLGIQGTDWQETLTYHLDSAETMEVRLVNGVVQRAPAFRPTR